MKTICFVCTGNICRSAMAHHYLQKKLYDIKKENEIIVNSCGTNNQTGMSITKNACMAISKYGVDASSHRSTGIRDLDIEKSDIVLCMTKYHKDSVLFLYPKMQGKVFTLKEYVKCDDKYQDIDDPWGYDLSVYEECARQIVEYVDKLIQIL